MWLQFLMLSWNFTQEFTLFSGPISVQIFPDLWHVFPVNQLLFSLGFLDGHPEFDSKLLIQHGNSLLICPEIKLFIKLLLNLLFWNSSFSNLNSTFPSPFTSESSSKLSLSHCGAHHKCITKMF